MVPTRVKSHISIDFVATGSQRQSELCERHVVLLAQWTDAALLLPRNRSRRCDVVAHTLDLVRCVREWELSIHCRRVCPCARRMLFHRQDVDRWLDTSSSRNTLRDRSRVRARVMVEPERPMSIRSVWRWERLKVLWWRVRERALAHAIGANDVSVRSKYVQRHVSALDECKTPTGSALCLTVSRNGPKRASDDRNAAAAAMLSLVDAVVDFVALTHACCCTEQQCSARNYKRVCLIRYH